MKPTTRVNLHCHSIYSDGELTPEALAEKLAVSGVEYAALTDHDSIEGLSRFHEALKNYNIGFLAGVEISALAENRDIHLLGYGFDRHHEELKTTLQHMSYERISRKQGALRQLPSQSPRKSEKLPIAGITENGKLEIQEAIALVHRAGGKAFWAHPQVVESDPEILEDWIEKFKQMGLDGLEITCGPNTPASELKMLRDLARQHHLLTSMGTDLHTISGTKLPDLGMDMPKEDWKRFVRSLSATPGPDGSVHEMTKASTIAYDEAAERGTLGQLRPRIVLPSLLAFLLFVTTIWGMVLPTFENILIDRKREMIQELTNTALSLLAEAEREARVGITTRKAAQKKAMMYIGALRYGKEGKDYFWIQDMQPRMLMHPYRPDLNGKDVSDVADPEGRRIFVEFTQIVQQHQKGFVEYVWQWKDVPARIAAKESYICGFQPWGWIIGTGMYIDDVNLEIKRIKRNLVYALVVIAGLMSVVLLSNVRQSLNAEKKRTAMQASLLKAEERYRSLIEATTEGTLLVLDGRCRYGNPTLLHMTGYTADQLELLELEDLLPHDPENETLWEHLELLSSGKAGARNFEAALARSDREKKECIITLNPITFADHSGIIVLARDIYPFRRNDYNNQRQRQDKID